jgi:hypothetical protein
LVEGDCTEKRVYRKLIPYLLPKLTEVKRFDAVKENNFYVFTGGGYPNIKNVLLKNSVTDIEACGNYDYLVVVVDTDNENNDDKIKKFVIENNILTNSSCKLCIISQNPCLETWFLGNRQIYLTAKTHEDFLSHAAFYNVSEQDPELMLKPVDFIGSISNYHSKYLKKMLAAQNINYSKQKPANVVKPEYFYELKNRISETNHLCSLRNFFSFCETISAHNPS